MFGVYKKAFEGIGYCSFGGFYFRFLFPWKFRIEEGINCFFFLFWI
jgi:hypothetical protein